MGDEYTKVKVILVGRTKDAVLVSCDFDDVDSKPEWIPLSLIHGADEMKLDNSKMTEVVEFRLREWKAEQLGL